MNTGDQIKYLSQEEIDKQKWDSCIDTAANGLIYGHSLYLDCMTTHWDGLVLNDYEAVMPLPWRKKWGIYYLYQPFLCASLGLFGKEINASLLEAFLFAIPSKFRYWDMMLNYGNNFSLEHFQLYKRMNHTLSLQNPYSEIYTGYRKSYQQLLEKSELIHLVIKKDIPVENILLVMQQSLANKVNGVTKTDYDNFKKMYWLLQEKRKATNYVVYDQQNNILASGIFLFSHQRAYYIAAGNHPKGRTIGASHKIIDHFIKDHAGEPISLDFEGSDIKSIAFFFKGFGAKEEIYPALKINKLPWFIRLFKK